MWGRGRDSSSSVFTREPAVLCYPKFRLCRPQTKSKPEARWCYCSDTLVAVVMVEIHIPFSIAQEREDASEAAEPSGED